MRIPTFLFLIVPVLLNAQAPVLFHDVRVFDGSVVVAHQDVLVRAARPSGGGRAIEPELAREAWGERDPLGDRERQVLRLAGEGKSSSEIGSALNLSEGTVRNYLSDAVGKVGGKNRIEASRIARDKGWL